MITLTGNSSWLFTATLVLAVGSLGDSGLALEGNCNDAIRCLDYFGEVDPHARQYSLITHSLVKVITAYVKDKQLQLRLQRKQASSELFGLLPSASIAQARVLNNEQSQSMSDPLLPPQTTGSGSNVASDPIDWTIYDADFFALPWPIENDQGLQDFLQPGTHTLNGASVADIPLFPIYDQQTSGSRFR